MKKLRPMEFRSILSLDCPAVQILESQSPQYNPLDLFSGPKPRYPHERSAFQNL